jgi:hypothetical protein
MATREQTRRNLQIAYDNRTPPEGAWCEGYARDMCDEGTEDNVITIARGKLRDGTRTDYTYCPRCRMRAEISGLELAIDAISDALVSLTRSPDESHRVVTLRATLVLAKGEAEAELAAWEAKL